MKTIRIALAGQPNVGKSELVNAISGANLKVANFTGVTVDKKEIHVRHDAYELIITDLPGIYSLNTYSPDEEIAGKFLINAEYDIIINVVDGNSLSKDLDLSLQLLDLDKKFILVLNMADELNKSGTQIDAALLAKTLGVPVLLASARGKTGIDDLLNKIVEQHLTGEIRHNLIYSRHIEHSIERLAHVLCKDDELSKRSRFYALRLLENDREIYRHVHDRPVFMELHELLFDEQRKIGILEAEENHCEVMTSARRDIISYLCSLVIKNPAQDSLSKKMDAVLINKLLGLPIFFVIIWILFQLTFVAGEIPMGLIEDAFAKLSAFAQEVLPEGSLNRAIHEGVIPSVGAVIGFLPNIIILFLGINLLEQSGYMARAAYLLDGIFKRFGLHGKSFIPLATGLGCSIPAYIATKTIKNQKDRLLTMLVISFFSCSARLPVYVLLVSAFFSPAQSGNLLFAIYTIGAVLGLISARILRDVIFLGKSDPFVMEMPRYRFPSLRSMLKEIYIRSVIFIKRAGLFITTASLAIWFLSTYPLDPEGNSAKLESSYIGTIGRAVQPIFAPLHLDWKMSVAAITGLAAKEVAVGTLATLNATEIEGSEPNEKLISVIRESVDFKAGIAFLILMMVYSPCLAAMGTFFSEVRELKWRLLYLLFPNILAWLLAFLAVRTLSFMGY